MSGGRCHLLSLSGQSFWQHIPEEPGGGGLGKDGHTGSPGQGGALVTSVVSTANTRAHTEMHAHTDACPPMQTCTHEHIHVHMGRVDMHARMHINTHEHACICTRTHMYTASLPNSLDSLFLRRTQVCWLDSLHRCRGHTCQGLARSCRPAERRVTSGRLGKASCCSCFWCGL